MKPAELYNRPFEGESNDIGELKGYYYDFLPEIEGGLWSVENEKVIIKDHKYFDFDGRRIWKLSSVWFDGYPVMITQNAGREGDDHRARFITDKEKYIAMIKYIQSLLTPDDFQNDIYSPDEEIPTLDNFYGNKLDGEFKR